MTTIKSHSDLKQSKKLAEILSLESADMCLTFVNNIWNPVWGKADDIYKLQKDCYEPDYTKDEYVDIDEFEPKVVPCWSLAALLSVIPEGIIENYYTLNIQKENGKYSIAYGDEELLCEADNPVDAVYEIIIKLHEQKIL